MSDLLLVVLVAVVAVAVGGVGGWVLGRRHGLGIDRDQGGASSSSTMRAIDSLVADGIGLLRGLLRPSGQAGPLTMADDGTITLHFSDIAGSTKLNQRLGDEAFAKLLARHDDVVARLVRKHDGRVVKTQGDGFLAAYHDPFRAVACALALRDELADLDTPLSLRQGVHVGSAVTSDGDVFGRNVAFAARVCSTASGGEVLVSDALRERLADGDVELRPYVLPRALKGIPGWHRLHRVRGS